MAIAIAESPARQSRNPGPAIPVFTTDDTIVAVATPPGARRDRGGAHQRTGVGADRPRADRGRDDLRTAPRDPRDGRRGRPARRSIEAVVTFFPAPHSYTGEDVVEISAHGSPVVAARDRRGRARRRARGWPNPGEFTLRAYLHGRIDLVQAEAVAELIDAVTPLQARVAFDQLEGTLTARLRGDGRQRCSISIARLEASLDFPDEGYHFVDRR